MAIHTLRLPAQCPDRHDAQDACGRCLRERLGHVHGIRHIDLERAPGTDQAIVRVDYDPKLLPFSQLDLELQQAGYCLRGGRTEIIMGLDGMVSPRSEQQVESALSRLPGVVASASFASRSLRIEFDRGTCALADIAARLDDLGYRLRPLDSSERQRLLARDQSPARAPRAGWSAARFGLWLADYHKLLMALIGGALCLAAYLVHRAEGPEAVRYSLVAASFVIAGWYTAIDTFHVLRRFQFDIDVLMFAAAFGAALLGHYEEGAFLLVLFALGGAGEELAMDRARRAIEALAKLAPDTATRLESDGTEKLVRVEELAVGEQVIIKPFERVPVDGVIVRGASAIDESPITGESIPVEKVPGLSVFAGTINGDGLLVAQVAKPAADSTLAKIVRLVNEAQTTKSPTQVFTDRVERYYVPFVLIGTAALIVVPPLLGLRPHSMPERIWAGWFYQAMAFLTAASPCALAIGTPAAVLSGIARAARIGVLVKGGVHLENLGRVRAVAFDKTGTLTRGRPVVTDVATFNGYDEAEVLALAAAVERSSSHPLASAIVHEAEARKLAPMSAADAVQLPGQGVRGQVDGRSVAAGRAEMILDGAALAPVSGAGDYPSPCPSPPRGEGTSGTRDEVRAALARFAEAGKSTVAVAVDDEPVAVIALADRPRENAAATVRRLKRIGIDRVIMLTGDRRAVAANIAAELGVDEYHAELLPEDKLNLIGRLRGTHGEIAMIGDGVNDAPALAAASVGIAMGGAGTDVALETADVALMADDLAKLPDAIGLSRFSRRIIAQNLFIALGTIGVLAPLAALGYALLGIAVLFHEGSTVVVVLNSLRLLMYRTRRD